MNPTAEQIAQLTQLIAAIAHLDLAQTPTAAAQFNLLNGNWENIEQAAAQLLAAWAEHHEATILNICGQAIALCRAHQRTRRQAVPCVIECA